MSTFAKLTSISGQEVSVRANNKARTYTIKTNGSTYRTYPFNKVDFEEADYNTANDWINFLNTYSTQRIK